MMIVVYLESYNDTITTTAKETAGAAKLLASEEDHSITGIIIDQSPEDLIDQAKSLGLSRIVTRSVENYQSREYADYILQSCDEADIVILPNSTWGQEIMGYIAVHDNRTAISNIAAITEDGNLVRKIHSNSVIVTLKASGRLVLSIEGGNFEIPNEKSDPELTEIQEQGKAFDVVVEKIEQADATRAPLPEADRIVTGGRGMQDEETFDQLIEGLADVIDASIGATRAVVDDDWRDVDEQIGQTGKDVSPEVYFAIGVSGAIQHISGMKESDIVVAINTDSEAPIFDICDYGIVGDALEVVPKLIERLKERLD